MRLVEINISGGDSAHLQKMKERTSRIWKFPDGLERIITLSGWHWEAYSSLIAPNQRPRFAERCLELAQSEISNPLESIAPSFDLEQWLHKIAADLIQMTWDEKQNTFACNDNGIFSN